MMGDDHFTEGFMKICHSFTKDGMLNVADTLHVEIGIKFSINKQTLTELSGVL